MELTAEILRGDEIAAKYRKQIANDIRQRTKQGYRPPTLAVVLIGDDPASHVYVRNKRLVCKEVGIISIDHNLSSNISQIELIALINKLNIDKEIDGILIQLPLPKQINPTDILDAIDPNKDVDGFSPYNIGRLAQGRPHLRPCTPFGVMLLLEETRQKLPGKLATVVGTSNIVGKPMLMELLLAGCTITACNNKTQDLAQEIKRADIIVVAVGHPGLIKGDWVKPGSIVIDVGMNRDENGHLVGDVEFGEAKTRAGWITPVPKGVGPMTVTCLMSNTLLANISHQIKE